MHPRVLLIQHLGSLQGVLQIANVQQKEKQKALLGKRVRVGDSFSSSVWYSQRLVGTVEQRALVSCALLAAKGEESQPKAEQAQAFKVTAREGNGNWGQEEKTFELLECTPQTDCFFRLKN